MFIVASIDIFRNMTTDDYNFRPSREDFLLLGEWGQLRKMATLIKRIVVIVVVSQLLKIPEQKLINVFSNLLF